MEAILDLKDIKKYFKDVKAVDGVSLQVEKGELFGFLGINGAGKSTTINMLCTILQPTGGSAAICGYRLGKEDEQIRKNIGVVYQNNCLDNRLTVKENLMFRGAMYEKDNMKRKEQLHDVCEVLKLGDLLRRPFGKLSGGQKRRCEIGRALMHRPQILFLDEPTTGLDPSTRKAVWNSIQDLRKELRMTVFLTTHYMEEAAKASHIAVIDDGKLKEYGTPFTLKEKYASDKLILQSADILALKKILDENCQNYQSYHKQGDILSIILRNSMEALPILDAVREMISGFEVVQGSMDDVFLNITGKELKDT